MGLITTITKPFTFTNGASNSCLPSQVNLNFDVLYNELGGNLGNANVAANSITASKKCVPGSVTAALIVAGLVGSPKGLARGVRLQANPGTGGTKATVLADSVVLTDIGFRAALAQNVNVTLDVTATGAGGLEDPSIVTNNTSGFVYVHIISDGTNVAAIGSLSQVTPLVPTPYIYSAPIGAVKWNTVSGAQQWANMYRQAADGMFLENAGSTAPAVALSAGTAAAFTLVSMTALVPVSARGVWFAALVPSGRTAYIAANSTQEAVVVGSLTGASAMKHQVYVLLETAQQVWYKVAGGVGASLTLNVMGWRDFS